MTLSYCRKLLAWDLVGAGSGGGDGRGRHNWGMNRYVNMALIYFRFDQIFFNPHLSRRWYGDYLGQGQLAPGPEYGATVQEIRQRDGVNNIIFSSRLRKINRHKQSSDRYLVIRSGQAHASQTVNKTVMLCCSEKKVYKLDDKKSKVMRGESLADVTGLSCGRGDGQLVVLHMRNKNDLVACLTSPPPGQDWVGELAAAIATAKQ